MNMETLLLWLFYLSSFYAFIPGLISRMFGFRVFRKGMGVREFALTFDDGPDPVYTPRLLDLLKAYDAKATFFVVGSNAERYPELIRRIHAEGHLIGIHNYVHTSNWLMTPGKVRRQIQRTSDIIHDLTGIRSTYYRPPWGIVNLFDFSKKREVQIVLWSAMFGDWKRKQGADKLGAKMLQRLKPGEVMLLHDCGNTLGADPGAPQDMLVALERMLEMAERKGLRSIRIDDMIAAASTSPLRKLGFFKRLAVGLWLAWERVFHALFRLKTVTPERPFLHYRLRPYQGDPVAMADGRTLAKGDEVIELHIDNHELFDLGLHSRSPAQLAIRMIRRMEKDLPVLAREVRDDTRLSGAKALYGVSMINRGPEKFGFAVLDLPDGWFARSTRLYLSLLLSVIHPSGNKRLKVRTEALVPKMMVMPMSNLLHASETAAPQDLAETEKQRLSASEPGEKNTSTEPAGPELPVVQTVH